MLLGGNQKGYIVLIFFLLYAAFLHDIKLFKCKIWISFTKSVLVVEDNNYPTKIVNAYIVYELDNLPEISLTTLY